MSEMFHRNIFCQRQQQTRTQTLRIVSLDLPADVAASVALLVHKTGLPADQLIIDILRDNLGSAVFGQLEIPQREAAE